VLVTDRGRCGGVVLQVEYLIETRGILGYDPDVVAPAQHGAGRGRARVRHGYREVVELRAQDLHVCTVCTRCQTAVDVQQPGGEVRLLQNPGGHGAHVANFDV